MKKLSCLIIVFLLILQPTCYAIDDWISVPSYQTFMTNFNEKLTEIDEEFSESISQFYDDKKKTPEWKEVASGINDRYLKLSEDSSIEFTSHMQYYQLIFAAVRIPKTASDEDTETFLEIVELICVTQNPSMRESGLKKICSQSSNYLERRTTIKKHSDSFWVDGMYTYTSEIEESDDGYIYFISKILGADENEYTRVTPYGYKDALKETQEVDINISISPRK